MTDDEFESLLPDDLVEAVARDHADKGWPSLTAEGLAGTRKVLALCIRIYPLSAANKWWYTRRVVFEEKAKELAILRKAHMEGWSRSEARKQLCLARIQADGDRLAWLKRRLENTISKQINRQGKVLASAASKLEFTVNKQIHRQGEVLSCVVSRSELAVAQQIGRGRRRMDRIAERLEAWAAKWYDDAARITLSGWAASMPKVTFSLALDDDDLKLAKKWIDGRYPASEDDYMRMHEARRAEKSAFAYYHQALGLDVQDVSVTQLSGGVGWEKCDLEVGELSIDVKNVRGGSWGGWILPRQPKRDVQDIEVAICGVTTSDEGQSTQTVTGQVTRQQMIEVTSAAQQVPRWTSSKWRHQEHARWQSGMGAWLMEYPRQHYKHWKCDLLHLAPTARELERHLGPPPKWLKALMAWRAGKLLESTDDVLTNELLNWGRIAPRTRPALFVFVVLHLLSEVSERCWSPNETKEDMLRSLFLPNDTHHAYPLGLHDPLSTIAAVVNLIDQVIERNYELVVDVVEFKFQGARIVRARRHKKGKWFTLLAYCGGCDDSPRLWAGDLLTAYRGGEDHPKGNDETGYYLCRRCLYLKCKCGYCAQECPDNTALRNRRRST